MTTAAISTIESLQNQLADRDQEIIYLQEQLEWLKRQIFGKKSERNISNINQEQLQLEGFADSEKAPEKTQTVPEHQRKKPNRNGQDKIQLPPDLPVETTILDLPEKEKVCKETGIPLVKIGEEVSYKLAHRPGS